jgi:hypothetical protein
MNSGLPVLATANGGLKEPIEDGASGWLTKNEGKAGLAEAFERALSSSPHRLAEMGQNAYERIQQLCGPEAVLQQQLEFRKNVTRSDRKFTNLFYEIFPGAMDANDPAAIIDQFIQKQPMRPGKRAAEMVRNLKRKLNIPIPESMSHSIYKFLARL